MIVVVSGSGRTSQAVGSHLYVDGEGVAVTASVRTGWTFDHWTLDNVNVGNANPYKVAMTENHSLTAVFTETMPEPKPTLSADSLPLEYRVPAGLVIAGIAVVVTLWLRRDRVIEMNA